MTTDRKAIWLVILIFVLGIAIGSVGTYTVRWHVQAARPQQQGGRNPANTITRLTRELNLTPEQQTQIETILNDVRARYADIHKQVDPQYERARDEGHDRIRQLLTPEQRTKFEDLMRRINAEHRKHDNEGHP